MTFPAYAPSKKTIEDAWEWANKFPDLPGTKRQIMVGRLGEIFVRHHLQQVGFKVVEGQKYGPDIIVETKLGRLPVEIKTRDNDYGPSLTHDVLVPAKRFARQRHESSLFVFVWATQFRDQLDLWILGGELAERIAEWPFYDTGDPWPGSDHRSKYPVYREQVSRLIPLDRLVEVLRA